MSNDLGGAYAKVYSIHCYALADPHIYISVSRSVVTKLQLLKRLEWRVIRKVDFVSTPLLKYKGNDSRVMQSLMIPPNRNIILSIQIAIK